MQHKQRLLNNEKLEIDLNFVYDICEEVDEDVERIIKLFIKNIPANISRLQNAVSATEIYGAAHAAKSALSVIKISLLYDLLLKIEEESRNQQNKNVVSKLINQCIKVYHEVEKLLQEHFNLG